VGAGRLCRDSVAVASRGDSGYTQLLITSRVEPDAPRVLAYLDLDLPFLTNGSAKQLDSGGLQRVNISYCC